MSGLAVRLIAAVHRSRPLRVSIFGKMKAGCAAVVRPEGV